MKAVIAAFAATALAAGASGAFAQETTTVVHKEMGDHSKTIVHHANGSKTIIKRHGSHVKRIHKDADGDRTVITKSVEH